MPSHRFLFPVSSPAGKRIRDSVFFLWRAITPVAFFTRAKKVKKERARRKAVEEKTQDAGDPVWLGERHQQGHIKPANGNDEKIHDGFNAQTLAGDNNACERLPPERKGFNPAFLPCWRFYACALPPCTFPIANLVYFAAIQARAASSIRQE
ncbi:MAG: hypothetical protein LBC37_06610 [Zoogloeaceae bacterium]|nr:hypothetical protein [Zoogloeaceae bacterium]